MSTSNRFSFGDMYHSIDEATALDHVDDASGLVAFQNIGSMLFTGDSGVPHFIHTTPEFHLRGGRLVTPVVIEDGRRFSHPYPPARIDDDLVLRMKKPVELPSLSPHAQGDIHHASSYPFDTQGSDTPLASTSRAGEYHSIPSQRGSRHVKQSSYSGPYQAPPALRSSPSSVN